MYYKFSPVMIVIVVLVIAIIGVAGFFGVRWIIAGSNQENTVTVSQLSDISPKLDLSLSTEEKNQDSVTIHVAATTDDSEGIDFITMPDDSVEYADTAVYEVNENGNYTFEVTGKNGKTSNLTIEVSNIREASDVEPYIPDGFSHVEGEVDNGFVIADMYGNQFVWVPVASGKLTRNTLNSKDFEESSSTASSLVNSVAQNYGFYIGRYEACKLDADGEILAGSMQGEVPWTNVNYKEAEEACRKAGGILGYEGYQTALINSFAWDTTLAWLDNTTENYSTSTDYGNYSNEVKPAGETKTDMQNNICDMAGNVREWTTEVYKKAVIEAENTANTTNSSKKNNVANEEVAPPPVDWHVIRGGSANSSRTASSHTGYPEDSTDNAWGFRMILYK